MLNKVSENPKVRQIMAAAVVWDNHLCMPMRADDSFLPELQRCRASGLDAVTINVGFGDMDWIAHLKLLTFFRAWISRRADQYVLVDGVDDIRRAKAAGKLAVLFDVEGMVPIEDDLDRIQLFYDLGVRWMLIAYNTANKIGGGCLADDPGLSDLGRKAIDEMERVGMITCVTHTGYRTARDVLDYARNPVIFSHSNPRALKDHPRNIPDDLIDACARTGGVIGINGIGKFLGENDASTEVIMRHIDYTVSRVGAAHVGISLDYCFDQEELAAFIKANPDKFPAHLGFGSNFDMAAPEQYPEIVEAMIRRGYKDSDISAILGGNWLRVAGQVWR